MSANMHTIHVAGKRKNALRAVPKPHAHDNTAVMDRMKSIRELNKLTQAQLGEIVGLDQGQISRIERGSLQTTLSTIHRIAAALNVEPVDLFAPPRHLTRLDAALRRIAPERREQALQILETLADT